MNYFLFLSNNRIHGGIITTPHSCIPWNVGRCIQWLQSRDAFAIPRKKLQHYQHRTSHACPMVQVHWSDQLNAAHHDEYWKHHGSDYRYVHIYCHLIGGNLGVCCMGGGNLNFTGEIKHCKNSWQFYGVNWALAPTNQWLYTSSPRQSEDL